MPLSKTPHFAMPDLSAWGVSDRGLTFTDRKRAVSPIPRYQSSKAYSREPCPGRWPDRAENSSCSRSSAGRSRVSISADRLGTGILRFCRVVLLVGRNLERAFRQDFVKGQRW